jgi:hypothetical protein
MQEPRSKVSRSKIGNSWKRAGNRASPGQAEVGKVVDAVDAGHTRSRRSPGMRAAGIRSRAAVVCTLVAMAYDQELAGRIRQLIGSDPELTEKKMFGGARFLIRGNMAIAASSEGGAVVRVDPAQSDALVATTKATPMNMCGQDIPGWLRVSSDDLHTDDQLAPGSRSAPDTCSLPPK